MLILVGPSASGKTEIANILINKYGMKKMVTYTTRDMRPGEVNGISYHFITKNEFLKKKNNNEFIEDAFYNGNYYGTLKKDISNDKVVILEPNGVNVFYEKMGSDVAIVFLKASPKIRKKRMIDRGDDLSTIEVRLHYDEILFQEKNLSHIDKIFISEEKSVYDMALEIYNYYHNFKKNLVEEKIMGNGVLIETSARHVHLCEDDLKKLFGEDAKLTFKKALSQPGQFACEERVTLVGPKKAIANVSILGPLRSATQVEISATDARTLGVDIAIRESGDLKGTPGCKIVGPCGEIDLAEGVIVAKRHIHLTPEDAVELNLADKEIVSVKVVNEFRSLVFGDVVVRVRSDFSKAMHIDTDESNAGFVVPGTIGEIIK